VALVEPAWPSAPQGAARAGETRGAAAGRRRRSAQPRVICRRASFKAPSKILIHRKRMFEIYSYLIVLWCSTFSAPVPAGARDGGGGSLLNIRKS